MSVQQVMYDAIDLRNYKQCRIAIAAGYTVRGFNDLLKGRKRLCAEDVPKVCKVLGITPNQLFGFEPLKPDDY